jgi:hypothetical protein
LTNDCDSRHLNGRIARFQNDELQHRAPAGPPGDGAGGRDQGLPRGRSGGARSRVCGRQVTNRDTAPVAHAARDGRSA